MTPEQKIQTFRDDNIPDKIIAEYFEKKFAKERVPEADISAWMYKKGLDLWEQGQTPEEAAAFQGGSPGLPSGSGGSFAKTFPEKTIDALPIVGDIAGSVLVPQLKGPLTAVKYAPKLAQQAVNLLSRATGSGVGGGWGSVASDELSGRDIDLEKAKSEAQFGAGGEAVLGPIAGLGKRLAMPAKGAIEPGARQGMELAVDAGLPVSRSRFAKGPIQKIWQVISDYTPAGRMVTNRYRDELIEKSTKRAQNFAKNMGLDDVVIPKDVVGQKVGAVFDPDFKNLYTPYKEAIEKEAKSEDGFLLMDETNFALGELKNIKERAIRDAMEGEGVSQRMAIKQADESIINMLGYSPGSEEGRMIKAFLYNDMITPNVVQDLLAKVFKGWDAKLSTTKAAREKFKRLLLKDLDNIKASVEGETAGSLKREADKIFGETKELMKKSPALKYITGKYRNAPGLKFYEAEGEKVVERLWDKGSVTELVEMKKRILKEPNGEKLWAGLEYHWMQDVVEKSLKQDETTGQLILRPLAFFEAIKEKEKVIKAIMPEAWPKILKEAEMYKGIAPDFKARASKMPMAIGLALSGVGGFGGGVGPGVIVPNIFGMITAWNLMGPGKKWLAKESVSPITSGIGKASKEAARVVGWMDTNDDRAK